MTVSQAETEPQNIMEVFVEVAQWVGIEAAKQLAIAFKIDAEFDEAAVLAQCQSVPDNAKTVPPQRPARAR